MDFHYSFQPHMEMNSLPAAGHESEGDEDDVFYAELTRQILILTGDDDDDDDFLISSKPSTNLRVPKSTNVGRSNNTFLPGNYFNWSENGNTNSVPAWLSSLWRNGNGTGVFIPHIVKSSIRTKQRRKKNDRRRLYQAVANKSG